YCSIKLLHARANKKTRVFPGSGPSSPEALAVQYVTAHTVIYRATGPIQGGSSLESGFEP
ncbi:hypothetical protein AVEN_94045-1, partial [Araneus ventricosus]